MTGQRRVWQSGVARVLCKAVSEADAGVAVMKLARDLRAPFGKCKNIDVESLAESCGIKIETRPLRSDALLEETETGFLATINSGAPRCRRRFSIAHEIGHAEIYRVTRLQQALGAIHQARQLSPESREVERLCNIFAAELLMPLEDWKDEVFRLGVSLALVRKLEESYGVSFDSAAARIIEAHIWHCAIILWDCLEEGDHVLSFQPRQRQVWSNVAGLDRTTIEGLPNEKMYLTAGSPLKALAKRDHVIGPVMLIVNGQQMKYFGESTPFRGDPKTIVTLILAEVNAYGVMERYKQ